jgi:hypothetical protein
MADRRHPFEIRQLPSIPAAGEHLLVPPMTSSLYSPTRSSSWMAEALAIRATRAAAAPLLLLVCAQA